MSERHRHGLNDEKTGLSRFFQGLIEGFVIVAPLYGSYPETPPPTDDFEQDPKDTE